MKNLLLKIEDALHKELKAKAGREGKKIGEVTINAIKSGLNTTIPDLQTQQDLEPPQGNTVHTNY